MVKVNFLFYIKSIKEKMNMLLELNHEHNKWVLNFVILSLKEEVEEDTLVIVREELHRLLQIEAICLTKVKRLEKLIENK